MRYNWYRAANQQAFIFFIFWNIYLPQADYG